MNKLVRKMDMLMLKGEMKVREFLAEERGDTNFISIAIILAIVLAVAIVFMTAKNDIMKVANQSVTNFLDKFK